MSKCNMIQLYTLTKVIVILVDLTILLKKNFLLLVVDLDSCLNVLFPFFRKLFDT